MLLAERLAIILEVGSARQRYVQVWVANSEFVVECVSNRFLRDEERLTSEQELDLLAAGFRPPEGTRRPNWWWSSSGDCSIPAACNLMRFVAIEVFGLRLSDRIDFIERHLGPKLSAA